jgi:hypothetical protein
LPARASLEHVTAVDDQAERKALHNPPGFAYGPSYAASFTFLQTSTSTMAPAGTR